ncbi:EAL domain-containing protein [Domibacillus sp. PGB-M46]|uniref:EAL domain-containing protein n=1 Tax=Domibacillus sp. PGB-M46 TaxID=2910255 RepID=UPI001F57D695|nr:EAL domain-containing protein [Domibacillus sp. PGB-M46]MCI2253907.1 EAL domain-containing protein [Domibacillus sp. PGB-M46]
MDKKSKILLVDDRPENLFALESVLENDSYELVSAYSGEEALKLLLKEEYAAILLDVQMPGINGFETAKIIKMREKTKHIPIIFVTAINKEVEHVYTGYSVGAIDYMFKPFEPETLRAKVSRFVDIYQSQKLLKKKNEELQQAHMELSSLAKELEKTKSLYEVISETHLDAIIVFNEKGKIIMANPAAHQIFQYEGMKLAGQPIEMLLPFFQAEGYRQTEKLVEKKGKKRDSSTFSTELQVAQAYVEQGKERIFVCALRDITERKEQVAKLEYQATHDSLTNLPNRYFLYKCLKEMVEGHCAEEPSFALILLDLDQFKTINDTLGHHMGDQLLKEVGYCLRHVSSTGGIVARLGGDEFALLVKDAAKENVMAVIQRIQRVLSQPFMIGGKPLTVHYSAGIALFPEHGIDEETLFRKADIAMYTAKTSGSGYSFYTDDQQQQSNLNQVMLMGELGSAIQNKELQLHYQAKVDIKLNMVVGVEALVRWKHPKLGLIFPDEFIPLAEQTGLIHSLTLDVFDQAACQIRQWLDNGLNITVSVNLSARNLQDEGLPEKLKAVLDNYQVPPQCFTLEITESIIMTNPERAMQVLTQLHHMGVVLSIDDFGTGYSSLAYLKHLPVNEIKVDKSFVMDMMHDGNDMIIVKSIIHLAHNLSLRVTAEGVENEEILEKLREFECDTAQGYFITKPLPADQIFQSLEKSDWKVRKVNLI